MLNTFLRKEAFRRVAPLVVAFFIAFGSLIPLVASAVGSSGVSFAGLCGGDGTIGWGMKPNYITTADLVTGGSYAPHPDKAPRTYTLRQLSGMFTDKISYNGEGEGDWASGEVAEERVPKDKIPALEEVKGKLEGERSSLLCIGRPLGNFIINVAAGISSIIAGIVSFIATSAFDSGIICKTPESPSGACINLVKVIGGATKGDSGGIMGSLTDSIYFPMLGLAVLATGVYVGWLGIVKRKVRESFSALAWMCFAILLGVVLLLNPHLFARAPMAASNAISTCVIGAFNGENCFNGSTSGVKPVSEGTSNNICAGTVSGLPLDEQTSVTVDNLTCSIWKAFILENYSLYSFGLPYEDLDVYTGSVSKLWDGASGLPDKKVFCFNLGSSTAPATTVTTTTTGSASGSYVTTRTTGKPVVLDYAGGGNGVVCNLAAYQMFLKTGAESTGSYPSKVINGDYGRTYDERWYNLIAVVAQDDNMWNHWTGSFQGIDSALLGILSTIIGSIAIVVISVLSLVYYLASTILMAFAPMFMLFAVHPGRGKKIFLGWLEHVVSNILKYIASAFLLIVTIALYAAVLGNINNGFLTLFVVIIFTVAILMYRKEFIEMLGKVNMGGEKFSNKIGEKFGGKAKKIATSSAGAAIGSKFAGGSLRKGLRDGAVRELKQGGGSVLASGFRQYDRMARQNASEVRKQAGQLPEKVDKARDKVTEAEEKMNEAQSKVDKSKVKLDEQKLAVGKSLGEARGHATGNAKLHSRIRAEFEEGRSAKEGSFDRIQADAMTDASSLMTQIGQLQYANSVMEADRSGMLAGRDDAAALRAEAKRIKAHFGDTTVEDLEGRLDSVYSSVTDSDLTDEQKSSINNDLKEMMSKGSSVDVMAATSLSVMRESSRGRYISRGLEANEDSLKEATKEYETSLHDYEAIKHKAEQYQAKADSSDFESIGAHGLNKVERVGHKKGKAEVKEHRSEWRDEEKAKQASRQEHIDDHYTRIGKDSDGRRVSQDDLMTDVRTRNEVRRQKVSDFASDVRDTAQTAGSTARDIGRSARDAVSERGQRMRDFMSQASRGNNSSSDRGSSQSNEGGSDDE